MHNEPTESELRWKLRMSKPEYKFNAVTRELRELRKAEDRVGHISPQLEKAFASAILEVKSRMHQMIDEL